MVLVKAGSGSGYLAFQEDAKQAAELLGLEAVQRERIGTPKRITVCHLPGGETEQHLSQLDAAGKAIVLADREPGQKISFLRIEPAPEKILEEPVQEASEAELSTPTVKELFEQTVSFLWALIPAVNAIVFCLVPIAPIAGEGKTMTIPQLLRSRVFWVLFLLMVCAGASEQAMSQWASAFAERGLGVSKTLGDLAGPCFFSIMMGLARVLHAKLAGNVDLTRYTAGCALLCILSYVIAVLPLPPAVNLLGCGLCGFSVGVFWPGTFSMASQSCPAGGTAMFALLALGGDLGCSFGPTLVGMVSGFWGDQLKAGFTAALLFPVMILAGLGLLKEKTAH